MPRENLFSLTGGFLDSILKTGKLPVGIIPRKIKRFPEFLAHEGQTLAQIQKILGPLPQNRINKLIGNLWDEEFGTENLVHFLSYLKFIVTINMIVPEQNSVG